MYRLLLKTDVSTAFFFFFVFFFAFFFFFAMSMFMRHKVIRLKTAQHDGQAGFVITKMTGSREAGAFAFRVCSFLFATIGMFFANMGWVFFLLMFTFAVVISICLASRRNGYIVGILRIGRQAEAALSGEKTGDGFIGIVTKADQNFRAFFRVGVQMPIKAIDHTGCGKRSITQRGRAFQHFYKLRVEQ